jgi:hypothetical protein
MNKKRFLVLGIALVLMAVVGGVAFAECIGWNSTTSDGKCPCSGFNQRSDWPEGWCWCGHAEEHHK